MNDKKKAEYEMGAFDRLPKRLREALTNSPLGWTSTRVECIWLQCECDEDRVIEIMRKVADRQREWGE